MDRVGCQPAAALEVEPNSNQSSSERSAEAAIGRADFDERGRFTPGNAYRWQPGVSPNPNGRRGAITDRIRERLDGLMPGDPDSRKRKQVVADVLVDLACAGNLQAIREVLDRSDGKVSQRVELVPDAARMTDAEIDEALSRAGIDVEALAQSLEDGRLLAEAEPRASTA